MTRLYHQKLVKIVIYIIPKHYATDRNHTNCKHCICY